MFRINRTVAAILVVLFILLAYVRIVVSREYAEMRAADDTRACLDLLRLGSSPPEQATPSLSALHLGTVQQRVETSSATLNWVAPFTPGSSTSLLEVELKRTALRKERLGAIAEKCGCIGTSLLRQILALPRGNADLEVELDGSDITSAISNISTFSRVDYQKLPDYLIEQTQRSRSFVENVASFFFILVGGEHGRAIQVTNTGTDLWSELGQQLFVIHLLRARGVVEWAEPNYGFRFAALAPLEATTNDMARIATRRQAPPVESKPGIARVPIGLIDTGTFLADDKQGCALTDPNNLFSEEFPATSEPDIPNLQFSTGQDRSHGTHMASIIGAAIEAGESAAGTIYAEKSAKGMAGSAEFRKLISLKINPEETLLAFAGDVALAIEKAVDDARADADSQNGLNGLILTMAFNHPCWNWATWTALREADQEMQLPVGGQSGRGLVAFASSGNSGEDLLSHPSFPASFATSQAAQANWNAMPGYSRMWKRLAPSYPTLEFVVPVGSVYSTSCREERAGSSVTVPCFDGYPSESSSYGAKQDPKTGELHRLVELWAPGSGVWANAPTSCKHRNVVPTLQISGTSFAAAHASGGAARIWSHFKDFHADDVRCAFSSVDTATNWAAVCPGKLVNRPTGEGPYTELLPNLRRLDLEQATCILEGSSIRGIEPGRVCQSKPF